MHVDMDAFFASVEQLDHPEYKGHPVIVGGLSSRGVVATASYEARKYGVHSAMPISRAKKLCPNGIYVYPNFNRYKEISHIIHKVMEEFTPIIEPLSLDEAFLDVTSITHKFEGPKQLGRAIKQRVLEETGLIISAGLAPNKFLAKLASDLDKPDGLVVIPYGREMAALANLPIKRIWGVGPKTEQRLHDGGFKLMKDIQALPDERELIPYVGNQARRIWELARGIDERPVEVDRQIQSIGNEETYEEDVVDPGVIDLELHYFANRVAKRLRKRNMMGHTVSIKVRYNDFTTVSRQKRLDSPTNIEHIIYDTSVLLWNKLMKSKLQFDTAIIEKPLKPIRLLGVTVSGLTTDAMVQEDLFATHTDESSEKLSTVLDDLESKFGESAIMSGALWQRARGIGGERRHRSELKSAVDAQSELNANVAVPSESNTVVDAQEVEAD